MLKKVTVFESDISNDPDYKEYYQLSEQILNKGGLTLVNQKLLHWGRHMFVSSEKTLID